MLKASENKSFKLYFEFRKPAIIAEDSREPNTL